MPSRPVLLTAALAVAIGATGLDAQRIRSTAPRTTLQLLPPPPPGPPPQGLTFDSPATYGIFARFRWSPAANVASYQVSRSRVDDPACCNATSGPLPATATTWDDVGLYKPGSYLYTLTVNYQNGSVGTNALGLGVQAPAAPTVTVTSLPTLGRVKLEWHQGPAVSGSCCIRLEGPGLGPNGWRMVVGGGPLELFVGGGTHTWKVAAGYNVANLPFPVAANFGTAAVSGWNTVVLAPPTEWATVTHTVNVRGGRFRLSVERFEAIATAGEDILRGDGRGNEVYIATQVNEYRQGAPGQPNAMPTLRMMTTPTFGDVHNFPNRVQAGSASPAGGIQPNDGYPPAVQYVNQLQPPTTNNLPFLLWEGELTELDGFVLISPAIWESDEDPRLLPYYSTFQLGAAKNLPYFNGIQPYVPWFAQGGRADQWRTFRCPTEKFLGIETIFVPPIGGYGDEPVDGGRQSICPVYIPINYATAASLTQVNPAMVLEVPFTGTPPFGSYKLFIRVEKVTGAVGTISRRSIRP